VRAVITILVMGSCIWGATPALAEEESTADALAAYHESAPQRNARLEAEFEARRQEMLQRRAGDAAIRGFRDDEGNVVLTNQPQKYQNRTGYKEIQLSLAEISVPSQYRNRPVESYVRTDVSALVNMYSKQYGLSPSLVLAVIKAESNFNPKARSPKGAEGLMQLMPGTAKLMGVRNSFDPAQNIAGGTQYLAKMHELFNGNTKLALAAYNAGPGAVQKYGGIPPYDETKQYIANVYRHLNTYSKHGVSAFQLGKVNQALRRTKPRDNERYYSVHFKSGLVQLADHVEEVEGGYYKLQWRGRAWPVRSDLIKEIVEPS